MKYKARVVLTLSIEAEDGQKAMEQVAAFMQTVRGGPVKLVTIKDLTWSGDEDE
jgi:hypothetical protein